MKSAKGRFSNTSITPECRRNYSILDSDRGGLAENLARPSPGYSRLVEDCAVAEIARSSTPNFRPYAFGPSPTSAAPPARGVLMAQADPAAPGSPSAHSPAPPGNQTRSKQLNARSTQM